MRFLTWPDLVYQVVFCFRLLFLVGLGLPRLYSRYKIKHTNMQSRITIEVDFENGNKPVIQILRRSSDDVRDKLISSFFESFASQSTWAKVTFKDYFLVAGEKTSIARYFIEAITPDQLKEQGDIMLEQDRVSKAHMKALTS